MDEQPLSPRQHHHEHQNYSTLFKEPCFEILLEFQDKFRSKHIITDFDIRSEIITSLEEFQAFGLIV